MKNEPVARINRDEYHGWLNWDKNTEMPINIPLYTHPVKEITLTKYEMQKMWSEAIARAYKEDDGEAHEFFARAILLKAQEK